VNLKNAIMVLAVHKNYNTMEELEDNIAEPKAVVNVRFPFSIPDDLMDELLGGKASVVPGCGCTSYDIDVEKKGIAFKVNAPDTNYIMTSSEQGHYLKKVSPYIQNSSGDRILYDIQFFVRNPLK
jgi:hypothetical protein